MNALKQGSTKQSPSVSLSMFVCLLVSVSVSSVCLSVSSVCLSVSVSVSFSDSLCLSHFFSKSRIRKTVILHSERLKTGQCKTISHGLSVCVSVCLSVCLSSSSSSYRPDITVIVDWA